MSRPSKPKIYIPKNRIVENLSTETNEFVYKNPNQMSVLTFEKTTTSTGYYRGSYWKDHTGRFWTGENPNIGANIEIIKPLSEDAYQGNQNMIAPEPSRIAVGPYPNPYVLDIDYDYWFEGKMSSSMENPYAYDESMINTYNSIKGINVDNSTARHHPQPYFYTPTEKDYENRHITRYFAKKINNNIYIEIDKDTYSKFKRKDNNVLWESYIIFEMKWIISGQIEESFITNRNLISIAEKNNGIREFGKYLKYSYNKFFNYSGDLIDRKYMDGEEISENLPRKYGFTQRSGLKCGNCVFKKEQWCEKWGANIRENSWCEAWIYWNTDNPPIGEFLEGPMASTGSVATLSTDPNIKYLQTEMGDTIYPEDDDSGTTAGYGSGGTYDDGTVGFDPTLSDPEKSQDYGQGA